jgi:DNA (cytosine-5)-methyltransferase 1
VSAYYNEFDADKAAWIRELIKRNIVAPGEVDERSIADVDPSDLRGFTQCHWFAGIAVWSYALRLAGWPDDRECWTGSCPCPSFSCAGKGEGFDDPRHLWPEFYRLIRECRPTAVFGEQSADAIGHGWWDLVSTDLESEAYAVAAAVLASASVGGADIRHRLYFVGLADAPDPRRDDAREHGSGLPLFSARSEQCGDAGGVADATPRGRGMLRSTPGSAGHVESGDETGGLEYTERTRLEGYAGDALKGFWGTADWIFCTDGRWRPVEAGTFPLADGSACRLGRLRGYGDAINAQVAKAFIESVMAC